MLFIFSIIALFFYLRPLKSPWHPFIAGDGLGYYAYLPATFIYHDHNLQYKWFNAVYQKNYLSGSFANPEDNFLVKYGDKKINKYYQGLSFIWAPFFFMAHLAAKLSHAPTDGFSFPYQMGMAFASLFYLILGLIFLRKLILRITQNDVAACVMPMFLFYGTHLFAYGFFSNTLSHVYSFTILVLFLYYLKLSFEDAANFLSHFLLASLFYIVGVGIRPLNALVILLVPVFYRSFPKNVLRSWQKKHNLILLLILFFICYQAYLMYAQTGTFFPYTYPGETFDFKHAKFFEVLFSYNIGLLVYVPILIFAFIGLFHLPQKKYILFFVFFFAMVYLYSAWWYWPINRRASIDYYAIPAIFLSLTATQIKQRISRILFYTSLFLCTLYYQLKNYQMTHGILDEFKTYKEIYWRNFFRINKANMYLVSPDNILAKREYVFDFENKDGSDLDGNDLSAFVQHKQVHGGQSALALSPDKNFCVMASIPYPPLFLSQSPKTLRFSMHMYIEPGITSAHLFIQFLNESDKSIKDVPFYLHADDIFPNRWDLKEFGYDITANDSLELKQVKGIAISGWHLEAKNRIYIDDLKVECLLLKSNE